MCQASKRLGFRLSLLLLSQALVAGCCLEPLRKGSHLLGKRLRLIQVAHMTGLCNDLELAILGGVQQCCLPFPVRLVIFPIEDEGWTWKAVQHGREVVGCQYTVGTWRHLPRESC